MTDGADGIGEVVTGGLIARAVEPKAGENRAEARAGACLNCGTALVGRHCHECGQAAHVHRSVSAWWHDVAHSVLHFEGKIWRTLPLLAWRPGELTRRFIEGERARFVSPMALFLFTVFLMFALFSMLGANLVGLDQLNDAEVATELRRADQRIARLETERRQRLSRGGNAAQIEEAIRDARAERRVVAIASGTDRVFSGDIDTGWARLDKGLKKANENPQLLSYKLQTSAYKYSWALIPISLPFLWLLFLHRRRYRERYRAYDHLVFITYSIGFMSMLLIAFVLLRAIGIEGGLINFAFLLVPPVHIYRQLRGAYALSRLSAAWRTLVLIVVAGMTMLLFAALLLALGVLA
ncbi:MAG TPA: DUF3667 domain-containing protein [Allosphingosinicella sp.]|nr:DUF3667 domain-containing protein [Allosphingosinicella sp.]